MTAQATYQDPYAGEVQVAWKPMASDKTRGFWKTASGQVAGGQARAMSEARCVAYAKWHRSFSSVVAA